MGRVTDALAMLDRARSLVDGLDDGELAEWLCSGLDALQAGEDPRPVLKLSSIDARRLRRARRDRWLRIAFDQTNQSLKAWPRCEQLASEIIRFETIIAPRWRSRSEPPPDASELRRALFFAAREDDLPTSARNLYRVCIKN